MKNKIKEAESGLKKEILIENSKDLKIKQKNEIQENKLYN